jgi:predicted membrane channel-forming protein YqfA (hemolysin III family)
MKKLALLFAVLLGVSSIANAISINISVGDQPYYIHGPGYWYGGVYYVWIPGHWDGWRHGHRIWIHGHYRVR